ncbi:PKD domain-containing protein, partial [Candidatus Bipolaricaulota bacterium]|nr:PKD domain-containing protein [Candidatus Bipolaricaulota bacterium]
MNKHISRARLVRVVLASALLVPLLFWISGCWLFNVPPIAGFSINEQTGQAPFTVNFSAAEGVLSKDEDGVIIQFEWDFGDGSSSGSGESVTHTYATAGTFTAVLCVTDNDGDTACNSKQIYVSPAAPPGPAASFTASPTSGTSPLTVFVNASASSYDAGVISQYRWEWGDGSTGYGKTASHTYFSTGAKTYTQTLTVRATDGKVGTATRTISVTVVGGTTPASGAPSARFAIDFPNTNDDVAPVEVSFDPEDSEADEGRTIASYTWTFGDGSSTHTINSAAVTH